MDNFRTALLIFFLVSLDQLSKFLVTSYLNLGESIRVLPFLDFTLVYNLGIAFSMFNQGGNYSRWILVFLVLILVVYLLFLLLSKPINRQWEFPALLLIVSGGIGNLVDRVFLGYVIDFIHLNYMSYSFYVFNIADSLITLGVIYYLSYFFFIEKVKD